MWRGGGRTDPSQIRTADLGESDNDPLLAQLRKQLRKKISIYRVNNALNLTSCVYSAEAMHILTTKATSACKNPLPMMASPVRLCSKFGSITHLTGSMGFAMAGYAINDYVSRVHDNI